MAYLGEYHRNSYTKGYYKFDNNLNDSSGAGLTLSSAGTWGYYRSLIGYRYISNTANNSYLYRNDNYGWDLSTDLTIGFWFLPVYFDSTMDYHVCLVRDETDKAGIACMVNYNSTYDCPQIWARSIVYETPPIEGVSDSPSKILLGIETWYFVLLKYNGSTKYLYLEAYDAQPGSYYTAQQWKYISYTGNDYRVYCGGGGGSTTDYFMLASASYTGQYYAFDELFIENRLWSTSDFVKYWQINRAVLAPRCV